MGYISILRHFTRNIGNTQEENKKQLHHGLFNKYEWVWCWRVEQCYNKAVF